MPRILVVTSSPLFVDGGHLVHARSLVEALRNAGHETELAITPQNRFGRQGAAYLAAWLTDVGMAHDGRAIDQVISLRYPAYAVRHRVHVCWLDHTMREYYDRWGAFSAPLGWKGRVKEHTRRQLIHAADRFFLGLLTRLFTISRTVAGRLNRWLPGLEPRPLYPPAPPRPYRCDTYGDYIFAVSRLAPLKRLDLVIDALARPAAAGVRCVIAGEGEERPRLERLVAEHRLGDRVQLAGRISDDELVDHLARCRAVCFPPFDEDYGFVTMEAFASQKPVITCRDSGGPAELVEHEVSGFVCDSAADSLAVAMRALMDDADAARRMGEHGARRASQLTWADAVRQLVVV